MDKTCRRILYKTYRTIWIKVLKLKSQDLPNRSFLTLSKCTSSTTASSRTKERVKMAELLAEKAMLKWKQELDAAAENLRRQLSKKYIDTFGISPPGPYFNAETLLSMYMNSTQTLKSYSTR